MSGESNTPIIQDAAEEAVARIEREGYISTPPGPDSMRRALLEMFRVNAGLVVENANLKRTLRELGR